MSGILTGKEKGKENCRCTPLHTEVCEDILYLWGLGLSTIVLVYICCPDILISSALFTLKYVLNMDDKLDDHLLIW